MLIFYFLHGLCFIVPLMLFTINHKSCRGKHLMSEMSERAFNMLSSFMWSTLTWKEKNGGRSLKTEAFNDGKFSTFSKHSTMMHHKTKQEFIVLICQLSEFIIEANRNFALGEIFARGAINICHHQIFIVSNMFSHFPPIKPHQ